uniref:Uncharacterized protein n=1 Tax=Myoviridae sp. ctNQV2 TaxID=2827683 RepID=A0A8S5RYG9_9CAUD|nr:MAG TPA: hypothetical protein [Myoviridae sp. ctNQV2]
MQCKKTRFVILVVVNENVGFLGNELLSRIKISFIELRVLI